MPNAAIVAAALTDHSARVYGLWVDGFDVIKDPVSPITYGVDVNDVVLEVGAINGGISTLTFVVDDPSIAITITDGQTVRFHDIAQDKPLFLGWVDTIRRFPDFGQTGRRYEVVAVGVESILDWAVTIRDLTFSAKTSYVDMTLACIANSSGVGLLRAAMDPAQASGSAEFTIGLALNTLYNEDAGAAVSPLTISAGTTLREAINTISQTEGNGPVPINVTVDQNFGLRMWTVQTPPVPPGDLHAPAITIADASSNRGESLQLTLDAGGVIRGVVVRGTGVVAQVMDGTGLAGKVTTLNLPNITTTTAAQIAGTQYLLANAVSLRGSVSYNNATTVYPKDMMSYVQIDNVALALNGVAYQIMGATYRFYGTHVNIDLKFGGSEPTTSNLVRRLTRSTLS